MSQHADIVLVLCLTGALFGCARDRSGSVTLARVGNATLTAADLVSPGDSASIGHPAHELVNDWVLTELLYQEAVRRGLADDEEMQRQMEAVRRRLAVTRLLDRDVYGATEDSLVTEDTLHARYAAAEKELVLREDIIQMSLALFTDRDIANAFRTKLLRGISWHISADSAQGTAPTRALTRQFTSASTLYPQELWKVARTMNPGEVSFPIRTDVGTWILQVHGLRHAGELPEFEYVRVELRDRIIIERRRARYERLLANLRARRAGDIHIALADTATVPD